jgi:hypothetical protein
MTTTQGGPSVAEGLELPNLLPVSIPHLPGVLSAEEVVSTASSISSLQRPSGMIPWFEGGHCDPWNHVEAVMALVVAGQRDQAHAGLQWLADVQLPEGAWFNYYHYREGVKNSRLDTNVCAYVATGVWHYYLVTGDKSILREMWDMVDRALSFVVRWQQNDGTVLWSVDPDGRPGHFALLTGSSSIYHALRCGVACAVELGLERPDWELAAGRLAHAITHRSDAFEPKYEYAMDWYYPVLCGALSPSRAEERIDQWWDLFVMDGLGVRCVTTGDWVTAAETAECALALNAIGRSEIATDLLKWTLPHRQDDGSYLTGIVHPQLSTFPFEERSSYTAGAIILAVDAISGITPGSGIFRGEGLPGDLDLTEPRSDHN